MHRKFQIYRFPLFQRGGSVTRHKISVKNLRKKPNLINNFSLKKTGNTFFSFVYIYKGREFKHLKFSVHVYYYFELVISFFSRTLQWRLDLGVARLVFFLWNSLFRCIRPFCITAHKLKSFRVPHTWQFQFFVPYITLFFVYLTLGLCWYLWQWKYSGVCWMLSPMERGQHLLFSRPHQSQPRQSLRLWGSF